MARRVQRNPPPPRGEPPLHRRPAVPALVVGQQVADTFGGSLQSILASIALLTGGAGTGNLFQAPGIGGVGKVWRIPTAPQAGQVTWLLEVGITILTLCLPTLANVNFGVSTSGMTIANYAGIDDGGILFMGTWNNINPTTVNWSVPAGRTLTISKNQASDIDVLISYVAHVG